MRCNLPGIRWILCGSSDLIRSCSDGIPLPTQGGEIRTLEGWLQFGPMDWIVRGIRDEYYPVKQEIFAATYQEVTAHTASWRDTVMFTVNVGLKDDPSFNHQQTFTVTGPYESVRLPMPKRPEQQEWVFYIKRWQVVLADDSPLAAIVHLTDALRAIERENTDLRQRNYSLTDENQRLREENQQIRGQAAQLLGLSLTDSERAAVVDAVRYLLDHGFQGEANEDAESDE